MPEPPRTLEPKSAQAFLVRRRVVRLRAVRRVAVFAVDFFAALRRRFLAGAFLAVDFFAALRRRLAGAFFAALRFVALRLAGAFFAALRLAGARFLAAFLFVAFFAGGTVTTFRKSSHSGKFELRIHSEREGVHPHALLGYEPFTSFLNSVPTLNFTLFEAAI